MVNGCSWIGTLQDLAVSILATAIMHTAIIIKLSYLVRHFSAYWLVALMYLSHGICLKLCLPATWESGVIPPSPLTEIPVASSLLMCITHL